MSVRNISAAAAAFAFLAGTGASAATFGAVSVTHKKSFSFTEADLFADGGSVATFTLPKANQNRKLLSAQWSMDYSVQSSIERSFIFYCDPQNSGGSESSFCAEGYEFFEGDVEIYSDPYLDLIFPDYFLVDEDFPSAFYGYSDYFFFGGLSDQCLQPYYDYLENPVGEPFNLDACMEEASAYGAFDEEEGTLGPLQLGTLASLAGPGVHLFLIDAFDWWTFDQREILLTGTAYITYNYGPAKPIPLPAALPLLIGGIGMMGLVARRRRRG
jgi:hypothetical protein